MASDEPDGPDQDASGPSEALAAIEAKWAEVWAEAGAYEADVEEGRETFFATYPYSYMNSDPHVGHSYTMMRADLFCRYQRMQGKNALFPFAFHVTGTPLVAAAERVAEGEESQLQLLRQQGIPESEIPDFADPWHFAEHFMPRWKEAVTRLGLGIDWRRSFYTTEKNPHYDAFIRWQFTKLKEQGYVRKGSHPVVWCPKDEAPVADHDRVEGEGEVPQEWTLIKLRLADGDAGDLGLEPPAFLVAATLRPETMYGQTNVWVDAAATYGAVRAEGETWLCSPQCADKLPHQIDGAQRRDDVEVAGDALVGLQVRVPARDADVPVLPLAGDLIDPEVGTGIVTSVPSDAPVDHVGLEHLKRHPEVLERFDLDPDTVAAIEPIAIIETPGYSKWPASDVCEREGIEDLADPAAAERALETATKEVYEKGFYQGRMTGDAGDFAGMPVQQAKERIQARLVEAGDAAVMYEPSGEVVCRCLTRAIVKTVKDQWFLAYGDAGWKEQVKEAMADVRFYPEAVRKQFEYVVDWLRDWACVREKGLGTRLPWDEGWIIESLSDSTIYMAYYTVSHILEDLDADDLRPEHFDLVFLGEGDAADAAEGTVTAETLEAMRASFDHWYPMDFRNSGKDLVQNHLTFMLFNHVAIFPPDKWPLGVGVNGWVMVDGEKMSKSRGNFITLQDALAEYGASATRLALANAGEGLDDPNFEVEFARKASDQLESWLDHLREAPPTRDGDPTLPDRAFRSTLHRLVAEATDAMEETRFRSALRAGYFDLRQAWNWYLRRAGGTVHADLWEAYASAAVRLMAPYVPHVAEEAWEMLGHGGPDGSEADDLAIHAPWPKADEAARDPAAERAEDFLRQVMASTREILKVTGIAPAAIYYTTAPAWKEAIFDVAAELAAKGGDGGGGEDEDRLAMDALMSRAMEDEAIRAHGKEAPKVAKEAIERLRQMGPDDLEAFRAGDLDERAVLAGAQGFLADAFGCEVHVHAADEGDAPDPGGKAGQAIPGRPAIYVDAD